LALAHDVLLLGARGRVVMTFQTTNKGSVMKKISTGKLSLNRETLVTLSPDALDGVNGGRGGGRNTVVETIRITTRYLCPQLSNLVCPQTRAGCPAPQGGQG
jgi:hypothetical protein